ncbi:MAG: hypothetical protein IIX00_07385, partial [Tidjanibacter sp.]|nr:hypothetical protein [Tidjanibacter sp.]
ILTGLSPIIGADTTDAFSFVSFISENLSTSLPERTPQKSGRNCTNGHHSDQRQNKFFHLYVVLCC